MIGTFPPSKTCAGHLLADVANGSVLSFARRPVLRDACHQTLLSANPASACQDCCPSFHVWPGSFWVGPFFSRLGQSRRQRPAHRSDPSVLRCQTHGNRVNSAVIITLIRGRSPCVDLSFSALSPPPCRPALATTPSVRLRAPQPALSLQPPQMAMSSWAPRSVRVLAPCATICASAAKPNVGAARHPSSINGHPGYPPLGGRFHFRRCPRARLKAPALF